jgi:hypothetical protein
VLERAHLQEHDEVNGDQHVPHAGNIVMLRKDMRALMKFAMRHFTILPAIAVFLAVAAMVLMGFFSYNAWNISCGLTGNDRHKIQELNRMIALEVCHSFDSNPWAMRAA